MTRDLERRIIEAIVENEMRLFMEPDYSGKEPENVKTLDTAHWQEFKNSITDLGHLTRNEKGEFVAEDGTVVYGPDEGPYICI